MKEESYCFRCGTDKKQVYRDISRLSCSAWGTYYGRHLWTDAKRQPKTIDNAFLLAPTNMQEIIKKAQEGGFNAYIPLEKYQGHCFKCEYVCDPLFWQSLGKACGWMGYQCVNCGYKHFSTFGFSECCQFWSSAKTRDRWQYEALKFHEINLTEGWDAAVSWLNDLIK